MSDHFINALLIARALRTEIDVQEVPGIDVGLSHPFQLIECPLHHIFIFLGEQADIEKFLALMALPDTILPPFPWREGVVWGHGLRCCDFLPLEGRVVKDQGLS